MNNLFDNREYTGSEKIYMGNGKCLMILNTGISILYSHNRALYLKNLLHIQKISKNLLDVSKSICDNNVLFEFHPDVCFSKDQATELTCLQGKHKH